MNDPQPQLPFGDPNTLEEIRRLLETQNELLRSLVERMADGHGVVWPEQESEQADIGDCDDLFDDEFWDEDEEDEEAIPDPPMWFAQHYPWE